MTECIVNETAIHFTQTTQPNYNIVHCRQNSKDEQNTVCGLANNEKLKLSWTSRQIGYNTPNS